MLSVRSEASRAKGWIRTAVADRDGRSLPRLVAAGGANVTAAATDRWRRPGWWCPCCDRVTGSFLWVGNQLRLSRHAVCPGCGSRSRHRGIALVLPGLLDPPPRRILHFAPEAPITAVIGRLAPDAEVVTTDLVRDDVDRPGEDIQALGFADGEFDLVVCNHVLEHVPDDAAAVAELARVTAPGGLAVITVPGDWSRRATVTFPDASFNGHHRDYGTDVVDLLASAFPDLDVLVLGDLPADHRPGRPGLRPDDRIFVARPG